MSKKSNPTMIGGFVVGAVALIASAVALFGGRELFAERNHYVAFFEEQTKGLRVGSNVLLNGVRIGYVSEIALMVDEAEYTTLTRVTMELLPDTYIALRDGVPVGDHLREAMSHEALIKDAGLRAQLEIESFITGQLLIRLDLRPETPVKLAGIESDYPEVPTIRSDIQELLAKMQQWMANIRDEVDIDALANGLTDALNGFAALTNSEDLHETLAGLNDIVNDTHTQAVSASLVSAIDEVAAAAREAKQLMATADGELEMLGEELSPVLSELNRTLTSAEEALVAVRLQIRGDSEQAYQLQSTFREVELAAAALRDFFDYLERNPEALIRGKRQ
jgi:paraquat-inducible protein B